jgi:hypothetical protein
LVLPTITIPKLPLLRHWLSLPTIVIPVALAPRSILLPTKTLFDPVTLISLPITTLFGFDTRLSKPNTILLPETLLSPTTTLELSKARTVDGDPLDKILMVNDDISLLFTTLSKLDVNINPVFCIPEEFRNVKARF